MIPGMDMSGASISGGITPLSAVLLGFFALIIAGYIVRGAKLLRSGVDWGATLKEFPHFCCAILMVPMLAVSLVAIPLVRFSALAACLALAAFFALRGAWRWKKSGERMQFMSDLSHTGMFAGMAFLFFVAYGSVLFDPFVTRAVWTVGIAFFAILSAVYLWRFARTLSRVSPELHHPRLPLDTVHVVLAVSMLGMFAWPTWFM